MEEYYNRSGSTRPGQIHDLLMIHDRYDIMLMSATACFELCVPLRDQMSRIFKTNGKLGTHIPHYNPFKNFKNEARVPIERRLN